MSCMRATKAIIHLDNLKHNIQSIQSLVQGGAKMCIAVKANGYGHGAVACARTAVESGADMLAVASVEEGVELRKNGITIPLLLLSLCSPEEVSDLVSFHITPFVFDSEYIQLIAAAAQKAGETAFPVHLAVDSGMGRIGCYPAEAASLAKEIVSTPSLTLGGMATHFAVSDSVDKSDRLYTQVQFSRFTEAIDSVRKAGIDPGICHCANSAATLINPEMHLDMVRPGIIVYGYYADEIDETYLKQAGLPVSLKPVMTLETEVCAVRQFKKGMSVGYGRTWTADRDTEIAVLPIGYGDGLLRRFAEHGFSVAINGRCFPVRGRICMDQCMVEIGRESGVHRWDKAVIFGAKEDGALQTADDIARLTGTISYEITTCLTQRVERVFVR